MSDVVKKPIRVLLSTRAIAEAMSVSQDFIYTEIRDGQLQAIRIGREYRITRDEAVRYLTALQVPVPSDF
jgi:excisionase family DNA binding protein